MTLYRILTTQSYIIQSLNEAGFSLMILCGENIFIYIQYMLFSKVSNKNIIQSNQIHQIHQPHLSHLWWRTSDEHIRLKHFGRTDRQKHMPFNKRVLYPLDRIQFFYCPSSLAHILKIPHCQIFWIWILAAKNLFNLAV